MLSNAFDRAGQGTDSAADGARTTPLFDGAGVVRCAGAELELQYKKVD